MVRISKKNDITDVSGILAGQVTDRDAVCGVTVILCPEGAVAGVDVRGSAPGTRETDLLHPTNLVEKIQAVVLSGGSVYGLAAADGVVRWLAERGLGFPLGAGRVAPIVPAAVLFDLGRGPAFVPPISAEWGSLACESAADAPVSRGNFGAGTGALSGGIKGGLGSAGVILPSGITVAALVAVNSLGSVVDPQTGRPWEIDREMNGEFGDLSLRKVRVPPLPDSGAGKNTTIGLVATDAALNKPQAQKIAQMAQDGLARAIRPAHTMFDGDTIFCLATGKIPLPETDGFFAAPLAPAVNELGQVAADCLSRAIIHGILAAESLAGMRAFRDLEPL